MSRTGTDDICDMRRINITVAQLADITGLSRAKIRKLLKVLEIEAITERHEKWMLINRILNVVRQANGRPLVDPSENPYG